MKKHKCKKHERNVSVSLLAILRTVVPTLNPNPNPTHLTLSINYTDSNSNPNPYA